LREIFFIIDVGQKDRFLQVGLKIIWIPPIGSWINVLLKRHVVNKEVNEGGEGMAQKSILTVPKSVNSSVGPSNSPEISNL